MIGKERNLRLIAAFKPYWVTMALLLLGGMAVGAQVQADVRYEVYEPTNTPYTLVLPTELIDDQPKPLIVALHFGGYSGPHYGRLIAEQLVAPALQDLDGVVLAPDCAEGSWATEECTQAVIELVHEVSKNYPIDANRIVVTGYSMGGIGTWEIAAAYPTVFSAAIVMAGNPRDALGDHDWQVPLYVIHAGEDELMPVSQTEAIVARIVDGGGDVTLKILEGVTHFETQHFVRPLKAAVGWLRGIWE